MANRGNTRHGMYGTPTYKSWSNMKCRCGNPNRPEYKNISYCKEWGNFENFLRDMGVRPEGTTLDRIDVNGNYEPSNCRWATPSVQANNRHTNVFYDYEGEKLTLSQAAKKYCVSRSNLSNKIYILKMDFSTALNQLRGVVSYG